MQQGKNCSFRGPNATLAKFTIAINKVDFTCYYRDTMTSQRARIVPTSFFTGFLIEQYAGNCPSGSCVQVIA